MCLGRWRWLAGGAVAALAITAWIVQPYRVVGNSMAPHYLDGDLIWTAPLLRGPERGEVVIFKAPDGSGRSMKRVAGLPGEVLMKSFERMQSTSGRASIETHLDHWVYDEQEEMALPAGHYFLLGDNLSASIDSRAFGPVRFEAMRRRVLSEQGSE